MAAATIGWALSHRLYGLYPCQSTARRDCANQSSLGVNISGEKELLGIWIAQTEGAKFWLHVVTELKNRGVQDIFIACVDGLEGFPEAIEVCFPRPLFSSVLSICCDTA